MCVVDVLPCWRAETLHRIVTCTQHQRTQDVDHDVQAHVVMFRLVTIAFKNVSIAAFAAPRTPDGQNNVESQHQEAGQPAEGRAKSLAIE